MTMASSFSFLSDRETTRAVLLQRKSLACSGTLPNLHDAPSLKSMELFRIRRSDLIIRVTYVVVRPKDQAKRCRARRESRAIIGPSSAGQLLSRRALVASSTKDRTMLQGRRRASRTFFRLQMREQVAAPGSGSRVRCRRNRR